MNEVEPSHNIVDPFATISVIIEVAIHILGRSIVKDRRGWNMSSKRRSVIMWRFGLD